MSDDSLDPLGIISEEQKSQQADPLGIVDKETKASKTNWWQKFVEFSTAGHVSFEPPPSIGPRDPESGLPLSEPSVRMGILEEPTGVPLMGAIAGGTLASGAILSRIIKGGESGLAWLTGGVSGMPKMIGKGASKAVAGKAASTLEASMAQAQRAASKGIGIKPAKGLAQQVVTPVGGATKQSISEILQGMDKPPIGPLQQELMKTREGVKGFKREVGQLFNSPEVVLARGKNTVEGTQRKVGSEIYKIIDSADQRRTKFRAGEMLKFKEATRKIKSGTESSRRVGRALDSADPKELKLNVDALTEHEKKLYAFLQERFHFLIHKYARQTCGTQQEYDKVIRAVAQSKSKNAPKAAINQLSPKDTLEYTKLKMYSDILKGGRKPQYLTGVAKVRYDQTQVSMNKLLEKAWSEQLTPGGREAFSLLKRKIKNYLPHIFEKDDLIPAFKKEREQIMQKLSTVVDPKEKLKLGNRLKSIDDSLLTLEGGNMVSFEALPKDVFFGFFQPRAGIKGYSFDAVKAYDTYLRGIERAIYVRPTLAKVAELHKGLDPHLKTYNSWFTRRWAGRDFTYWDTFMGRLAGFQWIRTLGVNPRSAMVNWTQKVNTVIELGAPHPLNMFYASKGYALGFTKKGKELFSKTGLAEEVPTVISEGYIPSATERVRQVVGFLFAQVEKGNRKHAFLSGYLKAKGRGQSEAAAVKFGVDLAHKTQFRYGSVGIPKALSHPAGRLVFQFWSYPIKQLELITHWAKHDKKKLLSYLALAEGGNYSLQEFTGIDLSNALGFGLNYGEALSAIEHLSKRDLAKAWTSMRMIPASGGGLFPSGPGPWISSVYKIAAKAWENEAWQQTKEEIKPVQYTRFERAWESIKNRQGGLYPVYSGDGSLLYEMTGTQLASRTIGPRPVKATQESKKKLRRLLTEQEYMELAKESAKMIWEGDLEGPLEIFEKYGIWPSEQRLENMDKRRYFTEDERQAMESLGDRGLYTLERRLEEE